MIEYLVFVVEKVGNNEKHIFELKVKGMYIYDEYIRR